MAEASISRIALRSLLAGFAIGAVGLLAIGRSDAQALGGHDSNAPVSYAADRIELQGWPAMSRSTRAGCD